MDKLKTNELNFIAHELGNEKKYWLDKLHGFNERCYIPYDSNIQSISSLKKSKSDTYILPQDAYLKLKGSTNNSNHKLLMILASTINVLLFKLLGKQDIVIGLPIDNQEVDGELINNVIVLRTIIEGDNSFRELLNKVRTNLIDAYENQNYPIESLSNDLNLEIEDNKSSLFDIAVFFNNLHDKTYLTESNPNILFSFNEVNESIEFHIEYNSAKYNTQTIDKIAEYYFSLLNQCLFDAGKDVMKISLLNEIEKKEIIYSFNETNKRTPSKPFTKIFEEKCNVINNIIAVVDEDRKITFKELNEKSNHLARTLISRGIEIEDVIVLMGHRSIEMIVSILAVMKAGAAYLPLNAQDPDERLKYILSDSKAKLVLCEKRIIDIKKAILKDYDENFVFAIDDLLSDTQDENNLNNENTLPEINLENAAYVIYTSGTTGKPKGVVIQHSSLLNYLNWSSDVYLKERNCSIPFYTSFSFDMSITSLFMPLFSGNTIHIYGGDSGEFILDTVIHDGKINILKTTPSHLKVLRDNYFSLEGNILKSKINSEIKVVIVGGENLSTQLANDIYELFDKQIEIFNEYGPTEATVGCMIHKFDPSSDKSNSVPIGKPIDNTQIYLLDQYLEPVPVNVSGEIYISGDSLARGYLFQPDLTSERFIDNPFIPGKKMYKTGDVGKFIKPNCLEYTERNDNQLKIRGYRIEVGEIESCILQMDEIKDAIVIHKEDNNFSINLILYFTANTNVESSKIKQFLVQYLPDYMIPTYFVQIDAIPLSSSGKLNIAALPEPKLSFEADHVPARNQLDEKIISIWAELLEIEENNVGINDNFFDLGGHSLKATIYISLLNRDLDIKITLSEVFKKPTIAEISDYILTLKKNSSIAYKRAEKKEYYDTTSGQKRLYFINSFDNNTAYNVPATLFLDGEIDVSKLEDAFNLIIQRHESLRTCFIVKEGNIVQVVKANIDFHIDYLEINENELDEEIARQIKPFDLSTAPLLRVSLLKITSKKHLLFCDMHHIISDGGSLIVLFEELMAIYGNLKLPHAYMQYKDYSEYLNNKTVQEHLLLQEDYWTKQFENGIPKLNLPTDYPRPSTKNFEGEMIYFEIEEETTYSLRNISRKTGVSLYMLFLSAYNILLSKLTDQEDIIIGTPVAGRTHYDLQKTIGMFVNTLVIKSLASKDKLLGDYIQEIKTGVLSAIENQEYHFEDLVSKIVKDRDVSRNPLFDVVFIFDDIEIDAMESHELKVKRYNYERTVSKFDLTLAGKENGSKYEFYFEYAKRIFKKETVERFIEYFKVIVSSMETNLNNRLSDIEIITEKEKNQVVNVFNDTKLDYSKEETLISLFEKQVQQTPNNIAIVCGENEVSYEQLNNKANTIAHTINDRIANETNKKVCILFDPSIDFIVSMLGVLKSGCAYVPLSPEVSEKRNKYIFANCEAKLLLVQENLIKTNPNITAFIDEDELLIVKENDNSFLQIEKPSKKIEAEDLVYVIYTSGTTGKPKGVEVKNIGILNMVNFYKHLFHVKESVKMSHVSNVCFDASAFEIWPSLVHGGCLHIAPKQLRHDPELMKLWLIQNEIEITYQPTAIAEYLLKMNWDNNESSLKIINVAGDKLNYFPTDKLPFKLFNLYGPTEDSIWSTWSELNYNKVNINYSIGKPISNKKIFIINSNNKLQPIGVPGELCISGDGLAKGYVNDEKLTQEKFVANPFISQELMYKTGDRARWLSDGEIEFLGRIDNQVKIRGNRVELGEIESQLMRHELIKEVVVVVKEKEEDKYLTAYFAADEEIEINTLRDYLSENLPDFMIPSYFIRLESLPLTSNGKFDRKALPEIEVGMVDDFVPASNDIEGKLVDIWSEVLKLDKSKISINSNFFDLGGHSINIIKLNQLINNEFNCKITVANMFRLPNIKSLEEYIVKGDYKLEEMEINIDKSIEEAGDFLNQLENINN